MARSAQDMTSSRGTPKRGRAGAGMLWLASIAAATLLAAGCESTPELAGAPKPPASKPATGAKTPAKPPAKPTSPTPGTKCSCR